jgi:type II secretory pathway component GspD/PulD (secretin)
VPLNTKTIRLGILITAVVIVAAFAPVQSQAQSQSARHQKNKKTFSLRVVDDGVIGVSLKSKGALLSDIAGDLSRRLKTRVVISPLLAKSKITAEFRDSTLEPAMQILAPHVYIDYEIRANAPPKPLGIFLLRYDDAPPDRNASIEATSVSLLFEGNTEDGVEGSATKEKPTEDPLRIEIDHNYLTLSSSRQPLTVVLWKIANRLGIPAEIRYSSAEIVNREIKNIALEDAIPALSPNVRVYVRADLNRAERTLLRLTLVPPPEAPITPSG